MKTPKLFLLLQLVCLSFCASAQVQWYQNQDGNNPPPGGTFGSCTKAFTDKSFVACYQWGSENETYNWKISKSHINGTEQRSFYLSGTWANVEMRVGDKALYVLLRSFPLDGTTSFTIYKLDTNLIVRKQKQLSFPNQFFIFNINAFQLDDAGSVFLTGDGQYPDGADVHPASFVLKTDRNLNVKWYRMDSTTTSYSQVQVDRSGRVFVIEDYYATFPEFRIRKYSSSGNLLNVRTMTTDAGRFNLLTKLDEVGNMYIYGGKTAGDTAQAMYLWKISRFTGNVVYQKEYFNTMGFQLQDLQLDNDGRIFTLITQYESSGEQNSIIARIHPQSGDLAWTKQYAFSADSTLLTKLVLNNSNRLYAIGARRNANYLSKGMVLRFNKNGNPDSGFNGPDSTSEQRSHSLIDGLIDRDDRLITIGNTNDFDPYTFNSTYFRAFAVSFGQGGNHHGCDDKNGDAGAATVSTARGNGATVAEAVETNAPKLSIYPNPVASELYVSNVDLKQYERISIYSLRGELLQQQYITGTNTRINVRAFPGGNYILVLHTAVAGAKNKTVPFTVHK